MTNKTPRIPLTEQERNALAQMLGQVPSRKVVSYDWRSEPGRAFIKKVRELQVSHVPLPWMAEQLDINESTLSGAVSYWERASASRGNATSRRRREKRILRKPNSEAEE